MESSGATKEGLKSPLFFCHKIYVTINNITNKERIKVIIMLNKVIGIVIGIAAVVITKKVIEKKSKKEMSNLEASFEFVERLMIEEKQSNKKLREEISKKQDNYDKLCEQHMEVIERIHNLKGENANLKEELERVSENWRKEFVDNGKLITQNMQLVMKEATETFPFLKKEIEEMETMTVEELEALSKEEDAEVIEEETTITIPELEALATMEQIREEIREEASEHFQMDSNPITEVIVSEMAKEQFERSVFKGDEQFTPKYKVWMDNDSKPRKSKRQQYQKKKFEGI
jgi:hypothetical protein